MKAWLNPASMLLCSLGLVALTLPASAKEVLVYFGTYTNALSRGIYVSRLDAETGKLTAPELAAETANPSFLAVSPGGNYLYAANSAKVFDDGNAGAVTAFAVDKVSGRLALLNQKSSGGSGPCHVSVDATGKVLFVANYNAGSVKSFLLNGDGRVGAEGSLIQHAGQSVNPNRQAGPHAHFICADPGNRFALACDLGTDQVLVYPFDPETAGLVMPGASPARVPPGAGARHLAFSRDGQSAYVLNEMACSITTFRWEAGKGTLTALATVSALPPGVALQKNFTAAEILVHPNGKFVYATLRGHDSLSVLATPAPGGELQFVQNISCGGKVPRGLGIDPTGRWLIAANQQSGNVVEYAIDAVTGKISPTGQELKIGSPVDVKFVQ